MLRVRIIPCLLFDGTGLVKTVKFGQANYIGDPINAVKIFNEKYVDEIIFFDINASIEKRAPDLKRIRDIAEECFMPFCYGGGISHVDHAHQLFSVGVEKVCINTQAHISPQIITDIATRYGTQSIVAAMDITKTWTGKYCVKKQRGKKKTQLDFIDYAKLLEKQGAGELFVNAIHRDGTMTGYDIELIQQITSNINIPVIASGGAGKLEHITELTSKTKVSGIAVGSLFVYQNNKKGILINYPSIPTLRKIVA